MENTGYRKDNDKRTELKTLYPVGYFSQECGLTILKLLSKVEKMGKCVIDKESQVSH